MSYRIAECLDQLRDEVNAYRPGRDKSSDGWIGDADHATRSSDHNPWVKDANGVGVVTALDVDEDDDQHIGAIVLGATVGRRDPRVKYVIYERKIWRSYKNHAGHPEPWHPEPYTGSNAHTHHIHVSVKPDQRLYDDRATWGIASGATEEDDMPVTEKTRVAYFQRILEGAGLDLGESGADGIVGPKTKAAVSEWQSRRGLSQTGELDLTTCMTLQSHANRTHATEEAKKYGGATEAHDHPLPGHDHDFQVTVKGTTSEP